MLKLIHLRLRASTDGRTRRGGAKLLLRKIFEEDVNRLPVGNLFGPHERRMFAWNNCPLWRRRRVDRRSKHS